MLRAVDLEVRYPNGTRALESTTLAFDRGVLTVLLGPSGAGKSTLLRGLCGLVAPGKASTSRAILDSAAA